MTTEDTTTYNADYARRIMRIRRRRTRPIDRDRLVSLVAIDTPSARHWAESTIATLASRGELIEAGALVGLHRHFD